MAVRNFSNVVAEKLFEKEGVYSVTITEVVSGMNKSGDAEQDIITVQSADGFTGQIYLTYKPTLMSRIKGQLQTLGINLDNGFDPKSIIGIQCNVDVKFATQQTKDEWGNITGSTISDFPNIRFTSKEPTVQSVSNTVLMNQQGVQPTSVNPLNVAAEGQPALANPLNAAVQTESVQPTLAASNTQPALGATAPIVTEVNTAQPTLGQPTLAPQQSAQMFDPNTGQPIVTPDGVM